MLLQHQMRCGGSKLAAPSTSALAAPAMGRLALRPPTLGARAQRQRVAATKPNSGSDTDEGQIGAFCSIDEQGRRSKRSLGEMEQDFLTALSAWYFEGKPTMTDEEFKNLKDELLWNGSKVAVLDRDELTFLEASMAYAKGAPIMSDESYNALKAELKSKSSVVAAEGPRCSIRSKKMYADIVPDYPRMIALNVPALVLVLATVLAVDKLTGFDVFKAVELPAPYNVFLVGGLLVPTIYVLVASITNLVFKDLLVLKGPCPNCGEENFTYFGDVFSVPGNRGSNTADCVSCGAGLTFDEYKRIVVVSETAEEKQKKAAELAAKKAASAAKKKARVASE